MLRKGAFLLLTIFIFFAACLVFATATDADDISVLFSPREECGKAILERINAAEKTIEVAMYYFTSRPLSQALVRAADRGVTVRVFLDGEGARERYTKAAYLKKKGVAVKLEKGEGRMHNKFCIIDDKSVITGSYNWTASADLKNDENVIFIDSETTAMTYRVQFEKYWQGNYADEAYYINKNTLEKHTAPR